MIAAAPDRAVERRARLSEGRSDEAIYRLVLRALAARGVRDAGIVDVGCGRGGLWPHLRPVASRYIGLDAVRYEGLPEAVEFHRADLNRTEPPADLRGRADVVVAVETIEHLENPRAFMRLLRALARPGGWLVVTTPNQLSLLSLASLVLKGQFVQFQDVQYPAHLTALLDADLRRMAAEIGLTDVAVEYSGVGRVPLTPWRYPSWVAAQFPRRCSDNVLVVGRRPA